MRIRSCLLVCCLCTVAAGFVACAPKPPNLTPQASVAFSATQVAQRVNEFENSVIQANAANKAAVSDATAGVLVQFSIDADKLLQSAPSGWQATLAKAWALAKSQLTIAPTNQTLTALVATIDAVMTGLGGS